jgi:hypothetical protein
LALDQARALISNGQSLAKACRGSTVWRRLISLQTLLTGLFHRWPVTVHMATPATRQKLALTCRMSHVHLLSNLAEVDLKFSCLIDPWIRGDRYGHPLTPVNPGTNPSELIKMQK